MLEIHFGALKVIKELYLFLILVVIKIKYEKNNNKIMKN